LWVVVAFFVVVMAVVVVLGVVGVVLDALLCELELPHPAIVTAAVIASRARFIYSPRVVRTALGSVRWYTVLRKSAAGGEWRLLYNRAALGLPSFTAALEPYQRLREAQIGGFEDLYNGAAPSARARGRSGP
jgi:hypothetical protein